MKTITTLYTDGTVLKHHYEFDLTPAGPVVEAFKCTSCRSVYEDEDEARECCAPRIEDGYKCPSCGAYHTEDTDAATCCSPDPLAEVSRTTHIVKADEHTVTYLRRLADY